MWDKYKTVKIGNIGITDFAMYVNPPPPKKKVRQQNVSGVNMDPGTSAN